MTLATEFLAAASRFKSLVRPFKVVRGQEALNHDIFTISRHLIRIVQLEIQLVVSLLCICPRRTMAVDRRHYPCLPALDPSHKTGLPTALQPPTQNCRLVICSTDQRRDNERSIQPSIEEPGIKIVPRRWRISALDWRLNLFHSNIHLVSAGLVIFLHRPYSHRRALH